MLKLILFLLIILLTIACKTDNQEYNPSQLRSELAKEAREDSLALLSAYVAQQKIEWELKPNVETKAIYAKSEEDAADDPAIWVNPANLLRSLVFGSNKKGGLAVYSLQGEEKDYYPIGNINNVDIIYDFPLKEGSLITVLGCSNRSQQAINLFSINPDNGKLDDIAATELKVDPNLIDDIYGFCFAFDQKNNIPYCIINGKNGLLQQFEMVGGSEGITLNLKRSIQFDSQTEGMVADNQYGFLYVGEEAGGIWKLDIDPLSKKEKVFLKNSDNSNTNIVYDVEGLSIYKEQDAGYLIASSQGNFSYAVFDRMGDNAYLGSFKIMETVNIDGVEETDGIDIVSDSLSPAYPQGMIVVQDGFNYQGDQLQAQNFKYVDWGELMGYLK